MTEARDIEAIVDRLAKIASHTLDNRRAETWFYAGHIEALIADWRAKKAEIERLRISRELCEKELDVLSASHKDLAYRLARTGPNPHPLPQSMASPADSQDGQA